MPKVMKVKCFILFFAVFIVIARTADEFDYYDCGSYLDIKRVSVFNCTQAPCPIMLGQDLDVDIILSDGTSNTIERNEMVSEAFLWMYGIKWNLAITPTDPCTQWSCPVLDTFKDLTYNATVSMVTEAFRRQAHIEILTSYDLNGFSVPALCVQFQVTIQ